MANAKNSIGILYVDDETQSLKYFKQIFQDLGTIYTAANAEEGIKIFKEHLGEIGIVLSDNKMPGITGLEFLKTIRLIDDQPLRILVTAYGDLTVAVEALNDSLLYSYFTKPWDPDELKSRLKKALDRFWITREKNKLLRDRAVACQELLMIDRATSIESLSSGLNHHMRNALTVIQSFFDMIPVQLEEEIGGPPKDTFFWKEYYENVEEQMARMISILSNLSEGAGFGDINHTVLKIQHQIELPELIKQIAEEDLESCPSINFSLIADERTPAISGDLKMITRLFSKIINEAKKNIGEEGNIEITLAPSKLETSGADAIFCRCIDNGTPIPARDRRRLFDPFFVRSDRPTELGTDLLASYIIVFQHGGTIRADQLRDERNVIEFILPVEPVPPAPACVTTRVIDETIGKDKD